MKFYELYVDRNGFAQMVENGDHGEWATRDDAEQAAKDAVEMARVVQVIVEWIYPLSTHDNYKHDQKWIDAQAIIERYEGGKP